jgi:poly(3-hydroxyalkanoate) depolymerase
VLAATATGALMVPGNPAVLARMVTPRRYVDASHAQRVAGMLYGGDYRRDPALVERTLQHVRFASRRGYYYQLAAAFGWTSLPWLWTLRQPTLILAGADDPIVPLANARIMQWMMPDARLEILDCGHLFLVTRAQAAAKLVDDFLVAPQPRRRAAVRSVQPTT